MLIANFRMNFKGHVSHQILSIMKSEWNIHYLEYFKATESVKRRGDAQYHIFQADDYDFNIFTEKKLIEKFQYIHNNPLKRGLVECASDYEYSGTRNYDFGDNSLIEVDQFGELW